MTDEEIRIKIAKMLNWYDIWTADHGAILGKHEPESMGRDYLDIPNYPLDLNACAEFEKRLTPSESRDYRKLLFQEVTKVESKVVNHLNPETRLELFHQAMLATPRQHCLAYLKMKEIKP